MDGEKIREKEEGNRRFLEDIRECSEVFPEAAQDPQSIPQEVWEQVRGGMSLVGAYARYINTLSRRELEDLRQRREEERHGAGNGDRSTGSMRSADRGLSGRDAFLQGFQD